MEHVTILETKLPTLNEYINVERTNRYAAASLKAKIYKHTSRGIEWIRAT